MENKTNNENSPLGLGANLHVVSFNVPTPPDYGGVIDVYYKLRALKALGVRITLHCFQYGRPPAQELEDLCEQVFYYRRVTGWRGLSLSKPYIVSSRRSKELLGNLQTDDAPILFEGLHCCYYLDHPTLRNRFKAVRLHNVEWQYYRYLAQKETYFSVRTYLKTASRRLKKFERVLSHAQVLLPISPGDTDYYRQRHTNTYYLPAFHPNDQVTSQPGRGNFILYHGNLSVNENHEAAMYVVSQIWQSLTPRPPIGGDPRILQSSMGGGSRFREPALPAGRLEGRDGSGGLTLIIAGKAPRPELLHMASRIPNVTVEANPSAERMSELMAQAHIHLLPTFQPTGIKLKLLNALFGGRFVITNSQMVKDTGLEPLCIIADDKTTLERAIGETMDRAFTEADIDRRRDGLTRFDNVKNAEELMRLMHKSAG